MSFQATIIAGGYVDRVYHANDTFKEITHRPGESVIVEASTIHQITKLLDVDIGAVARASLRRLA